MLPLTKLYAVQLLEQSAKLLANGDAEAQTLASEIGEAIKFSLYALAAKEARNLPSAERVKPRKEREPYVLSPELQQRHDKIAAKFLSGERVIDIAREFGVTHQRIRQLAKTMGLSRPSTIGKRQAAIEQQRARSDARCMAKWGVDYAGMKALRKSGISKAFQYHRNAAHSRAEIWSMTFVQWHQVWIDGGKLDKRGRGRGSYVMVRRDAALPWEVGNVKIALFGDMVREVRARTRGNVSRYTGVYNLYPGLSKPWVARAAGKLIGSFATAAEGVAARDRALAAQVS